MRHAAKYTPELWRERFSKLLLMRPTWNHSIGCAKSSTTQLMSVTAKVVKLSGIFPNSNYRGEKLKKKLENCEA